MLRRNDGKQFPVADDVEIPVHRAIIKELLRRRLHQNCAVELRRLGTNNFCPLCRRPTSELRTVSAIIDEHNMLEVRFNVLMSYLLNCLCLSLPVYEGRGMARIRTHGTQKLEVSIIDEANPE